MNFQTVLLFPIIIIYCFTCIHFSEASSSSLTLLNNAAIKNLDSTTGIRRNNNIQKSVKTTIMPFSATTSSSSTSSSSIRSSSGNNQKIALALSTIMNTKNTGADGEAEMTTAATTNTRTDAVSESVPVARMTTGRSNFLRGSLLSAPLAFISSLMTVEQVNAKASLSSSTSTSSIEDFVGTYSDPKFPGCLRMISLYDDKEGEFYLFVQGQVGNPGPGCENENNYDTNTNINTNINTKTKKTKKTNWEKTQFVIVGMPEKNGKTATFNFSTRKNESRNVLGIFFCEEVKTNQGNKNDNLATENSYYKKGIYFEDGTIWNRI